MCTLCVVCNMPKGAATFFCQEKGFVCYCVFKINDNITVYLFISGATEAHFSHCEKTNTKRHTSPLDLQDAHVEDPVGRTRQLLVGYLGPCGRVPVHLEAPPRNPDHNDSTAAPTSPPDGIQVTGPEPAGGTGRPTCDPGWRRARRRTNARDWCCWCVSGCCWWGARERGETP